MVTQPAGMDAGRHKVVAEGIHHGNRRYLGGIAVIKGINPFCQSRAGGRFNGNTTHLFAGGPISNKGESQSGKVGTATAAGNNHIRIVSGNFHLLLCFLTDDGLMQADMV